MVADDCHRRVPTRLLLLAVGSSNDDIRVAHALARRAAGVYAETSTVLHSTRAFGDLPEVLVQEWEAVVADIERHLERRLSPGGETSTTGPST